MTCTPWPHWAVTSVILCDAIRPDITLLLSPSTLIVYYCATVVKPYSCYFAYCAHIAQQTQTGHPKVTRLAARTSGGLVGLSFF